MNGQVEQSMLDFERNIVVAAGWKTANENPVEYDASYGAFIQVMEYRRKIAKEFLYETNPEKKELIKKLFVEVNEKIKQILGL